MPQTDRDPFWNDEALFRGETPPDYSGNHDGYLYDDVLR